MKVPLLSLALFVGQVDNVAGRQIVHLQRRFQVDFDGKVLELFRVPAIVTGIYG